MSHFPHTTKKPKVSLVTRSLLYRILNRWALKDATPLCVASMYSHPELVRWLLLHGADRSSPCYLKQTALDFVGECCEHTSTVSVSSLLATGTLDKTSVVSTQKTIANASEECRRLLLEPPSLPYPPEENVTLSSTFSSEVVLVRSPAVTPVAPTRSISSGSGGTGDLSSPQAAGATRKMTPVATLQQKIFRCVVHIAWQTPFANGAIIDKYEVRYRIIVAEDGEETGRLGSGGSGASGSEGWRLERATHNRKTREQKILLTGLQFDTLYEFMLRSWNAAGKGDWGRSYKFQTRESPDLTATAS